jgi:CelD/BcsL family acetyltransferase involved in cellulose biosynthesis
MAKLERFERGDSSVVGANQFMNVERIADVAGLQALEPAWSSLHAGNPFLSPEWLSTWWEYYGQAAQARHGFDLCVLKVTDDDGRVAAIAPWYLQSNPIRGRVLSFLGAGDVCSEYLSVVCRSGCETSVARALSGWLLDAPARTSNGARTGDHWDQLSLANVAADDAVMRKLAEELEARGALVSSRSGPACWRIELPATRDEYFAILSRSHRKELRWCERKYFDTGLARLHTVLDASALVPTLERLTAFHRQRFPQSCFLQNRFAGFHRAVLPRLLASGRLRLHWLELEGHCVAVEYHLQGDQTVYAYQSGIDVGALRHGPGRLAGLAVIDRALREGFRTYDLLRGDEAYKRHWRATPRANVDFRIHRPTASGKLRHVAHETLDRAKAWLRQRVRPDVRPMKSDSAESKPSVHCTAPTSDVAEAELAQPSQRVNL